MLITGNQGMRIVHFDTCMTFAATNQMPDETPGMMFNVVSICYLAVR